MPTTYNKNEQNQNILYCNQKWELIYLKSILSKGAITPKYRCIGYYFNYIYVYDDYCGAGAPFPPVFI